MEIAFIRAFGKRFLEQVTHAVSSRGSTDLTASAAARGRSRRP
jgi:hypothetical protein